jgi:CheY-like chemotaxis protein
VNNLPVPDKSLIANCAFPQLLIADDDPGIVRFLAKRCSAMGFRVQTTVNGLNALLLAARIRPDVLIVDINMPEVDGLTVSDRLMQSDNKPCGIIVMTASAYPESAQRCERIGAHYVRKGIDLWNDVRSALVEIFPDTPFEDDKTIEAPRLEFERTRVLLIDGHRDAGRFLSTKLTTFGVDTLIARDVSEGLKIAIGSEPTVIILELPMLLGDPYYLVSSLRANPKTARTPVFVTSAHPIDDTTKAHLRRDILGHPGVMHFIVKSPTFEELFTALQQFCAFSTGPGEEDIRAVSAK